MRGQGDYRGLFIFCLDNRTSTDNMSTVVGPWMVAAVNGSDRVRSRYGCCASKSIPGALNATADSVELREVIFEPDPCAGRAAGAKKGMTLMGG